MHQDQGSPSKNLPEPCYLTCWSGKVLCKKITPGFCFCVLGTLWQWDKLLKITVKLDLRNNNLHILPRGAFLHTPYLTHLNLQRCNIIKVKEGALRALGRLVLLNLAYNKIDLLYQESFDGLSSLKELHLDHNRIEEIQPGAFSQLGPLNMLALNHNQLVYIPNMVFQGLQNIKWLRMGHNSLNNLAPEAFAGLFTLNRLSLEHNELQFFPTQTMMRLPEVTHLDMSYNPMTYLGEEAVSMRKLRHLLLHHMSLQDLSDQALSKAPFLSHVDLSFNQLRYIEPLSGPKELDVLNLTGNPIYCNCYLKPLKEWATAGGVKLRGACTGPPHLSEELLQETETHHATCEGQGHTKVPRGFPAKTQLLDLRGNHFHYIPALSFPGTVQVVSLHLESCGIREIEGGAFQGMNHLLYLYLSDNNLTLLDPKIFAGIQNLTYLHLEGNHLTQFPGSGADFCSNRRPKPGGAQLISKSHSEGGRKAFQPVSQSLKRLYMDQMGMEKISQDALQDLGSVLRILTVRGNLLKELPDLRLFTSLEGVDLRDNPLLCSCALLPLRRWMETVRFEVSATCGNPPDLRGQQVRDADVFTSCPENASTNEKGSREPGPLKTKKSKPGSLKPPKVKTGPVNSKLRKSSKKKSQKKSATSKVTKMTF
ncbi:hypothetical protein OJAV_G00075430 [Oryzias javanicus]|uniref:LRRCT domain-containing protein n=1 Tax=Oryzias javanicus TaxID=123683 RepID=A0A3S2UEG0_ORYJA|nr:hypothetical protein OJAV_G00075430 [Oryzias javanicus]